MSDGFQLATGKSVKIAILDDGIWPADLSTLIKLTGAEFLAEANGQVVIQGDGISRTPGSHGTLCAAIISNRVPDAVIYSLKVKETASAGHPVALAAAIDWALAYGIAVINISLGTTDRQYRDRLREHCLKATLSGSVIVTAAHIRGLECYPAAFPETIAVGMDDRYTGYDYGYLPGRMSEFVAAGDPPILSDPTTGARLEPRPKPGTSFAAARMTANAAAIRELLPRASQAEVRMELARRHKGLSNSTQPPSPS